MSKLTSTVIKLVLAALALAGCIVAIVHFWDDLTDYIVARQKLHRHKRLRRVHGFHRTQQKDYADLDLEQAGI